jgi:hypothetical protein
MPSQIRLGFHMIFFLLGIGLVHEEVRVRDEAERPEDGRALAPSNQQHLASTWMESRGEASHGRDRWSQVHRGSTLNHSAFALASQNDREQLQDLPLFLGLWWCQIRGHLRLEISGATTRALQNFKNGYCRERNSHVLLE